MAADFIDRIENDVAPAELVVYSGFHFLQIFPPYDPLSVERLPNI
jgi:hypothetical protein